MPSPVRSLVAPALLLAALGTAPASAQEKEKPAVVEDGHRISIEYTLKLPDGSVADTNVDGEALTYVQGQSQILPALESQLAGMKVGESKHVALSAAEGYGEVDPGLFQTVPASAVPEDARVVGTELLAQPESGPPRPVRVHEVKGDEIVMDLNHPLAGKALAFDIKILAIE